MINSLNSTQTDALTELINIAFGLTAAKLSEISGCRIRLDAPVVGVHKLHALAGELRRSVTGPAVSVRQIFGGPISGDAILFLSYEDAIRLSNLIVEDDLPSRYLDTCASEILIEVGNMLLGACLSVLGNLLEVRVSFSIPHLKLDSVDHFLASLSHNQECRHPVVVTASFSIRDHGVGGWLAIAMDVPSLERLTQAVDRWEGSCITT